MAVNQSVRFDYHTHHERCGHARGRIEEYVRAAIDLGLREIGISDHAPLYWREGDHPQPGSAMARSALGEYVDEVLTLRGRYQDRIAIRLGLEADYVPGFDDVYREILARYPFDYVIGSVHYCGGWHIYQQERWTKCPDPDSAYSDYFHLVRESARSGLFDVLGHITGLLAYGPVPSPPVREREFDETARAIAETGVAIEVNASGLRKGTGHPFPAADLLCRCLDARIPITYGSDAHRPDEVGHAGAEIARLIEDAEPWEPGRRPGAAA